MDLSTSFCGLKLDNPLMPRGWTTRWGFRKDYGYRKFWGWSLSN